MACQLRNPCQSVFHQSRRSILDTTEAEVLSMVSSESPSQEQIRFTGEC
jgi:hypothetical protein